jgi:PAS domain S-box-containing protein
MISPTVVAIAVAAPLAVALICLFAWRRFDGGRHLLYWAIGHAAAAVPFATVGLIDWTAERPGFLLTTPAAIGTLLWASMLVAGIRHLTGKQDEPRRIWLVTAIIILGVLILRQLDDRLYLGATPIVGGIISFYGAGLLLRHWRSVLHTSTGLLLAARSLMAIYYGSQLISLNAALSDALALSAFFNLLTGIGLIMIEFDNARRREVEAREAEHEMRGFFETLLESMPATMTYKDSELRYRIINRRMRELLPDFSEDYIGRRWSDIIGPDAAATVENLDRHILATGDPSYMEQAWTGQDGRTQVIWALKVPLKHSDGRVLGVITCGIDVSRLKETEAQLIDQREAAEAASRAKTSFLANMSHELRTPLNAIIGFAEMMATGYAGPLSGRQNEYAIHIRDSGEHLLRLVNDILDLSRLESGRMDMHIDDCRFDRIAQNALAMVAPQARQADVTLDYVPQPLTVRVDERALTQILINLLGNAVKFNRPGGSVSLHAESGNGITRIRVSDTGQGMSESESRAVVQPLYRADVFRTRPNSGAGLGLSICRSLVELHGGRLDIRSSPGEGTTVDIALPD